MLRRDGGLTRARGAIFGNPVATGATVTCFMAVVLACVAFAPSTSSRARARSTSESLTEVASTLAELAASPLAPAAVRERALDALSATQRLHQSMLWDKYSDSRPTVHQLRPVGQIPPTLDVNAPRPRYVDMLPLTETGREPRGDDGALYSIGRLLRQGYCVPPPFSASADGHITVVLYKGVVDDSVALGWATLDAPPGRHYNQWARAEVEVAQCSQPCTMTRDQSKLPVADAVVFEPVNHHHHFGGRWMVNPMDLPPNKPWGQLWGGVHYETSREFPILKTRSAVTLFDFWVTYRADAEAQVSFTCPWGATAAAYLEPPPIKTRSKLVAYVTSRCEQIAPERHEYVAQLMKHIPVHSYGKCHHNMDFPKEKAEDFQAWPRLYNAKIELFKEYMFVLAFENNNVTDYVTEKLPQAFQALAVPVYMGAPNVDEWLPGERSIIKTADFTSPQALAEYLLWLADHPEEYNKYFDWKSKGLAPQFVKRLHQCVLTHAHCQVCDFVRHARCVHGDNRVPFAVGNV